MPVVETLVEFIMRLQKIGGKIDAKSLKLMCENLTESIEEPLEYVKRKRLLAIRTSCYIHGFFLTSFVLEVVRSNQESSHENYSA